MSMRKYWTAFAALTLLVPTVAFAVPHAPPVRPTEVSLAQAREAFFGLEASVNTTDGQVILGGMVSDACKNKFKLENKGEQDGKTVFVLTETGGLQCVRDSRQGGKTCGNGIVCVRMSQNSGFRAVFDKTKSTTFALGYTDPNRDTSNRTLDVLKNVDNQDLAYQSQADRDRIARERLAALEAQEARELAASTASYRVRLKDQVSTCRRTDRELTVARSALRELCRLPQDENDPNRVDCSALDSELTREELKRFAWEAQNHALDDIDVVLEKVRAWVSQHQDMADKVGLQVYYVIERRLIDAHTPAAAQRAVEIAHEAQGLDGISGSAKAKFTNHERELRVIKASFMAEQGTMNNYQFVPEYSSLMNDLSRDAWRSCSGMRVDMVACGSAQSTLRVASRLPDTAQRADQMQYRQQMELQRMLGGAGGGAYGAYGPAGSPYGGYGMSPYSGLSGNWF